MRRIALAAGAALALLAACSSSTARPQAVVTTPTATDPRATLAPSSTTASVGVSSTARPPTTTMPPPATAPPPTPAPTSPPVVVTTPAPPTTARPPAPPQAQMIVVDATGYGQTAATLTAYDRTAAGWVARFGPWTARIGRNGFAPAGAKREGDGRTPSGTYGFSFFFGIDANPGVRFPYRPVTGPSIVWDDDPSSANYNEWIDTRLAAAGARPEPMDNAPVYDYGAVIAYNVARTPGLGSAIFFHVSDGGSTAGCVALPVQELLDVLRWLDPSVSPQIRMGVNVGGPA